MTNKVLALKWRPRRFSEVVEQSHVVKALQHGLKTQNLHHAYFFTGTRGIGKTTLARILAKAVNCINPVDNIEPCCECEHCIAIDKGTFPDLLELDAATNTGIDHMRELQDTLVYPPYTGKKKIYVIDEVHMLSKEAFNAMLKTFEEPPEYLIFVLATTDPQKVPVTVLSRCLQFNLKPLPEIKLIEHYQRVLTNEKIEFEEKALPLIAKAADGSVRDGLSLLDQLLAQGGGKIIYQDVVSILGVIGKDWAMPIIEKIIAKDIEGLISAADEMQTKSLSFDDALAELADNLFAIQIVQMQGPCPSKVDKPKAEQLAKIISADDLQLMYQIAIKGREDLAYAPNHKSGFLMSVLRMQTFLLSPELNEIPSRINSQINDSKTNFDDHQSFDNQLNNKKKTEEKLNPAAKPSKNISNYQLDINTLIDNWHNIVNELTLPPSLRRLVQYIAPIEFEIKTDDLQGLNQLIFILAESEQHLLSDGSTTKLSQHLSEYFKKKYALDINCQYQIGELSAKSIAYQNQANQKLELQKAKEQIENEPIVKELKSRFGAKLIEDSIKIL